MTFITRALALAGLVWICGAPNASGQMPEKTPGAGEAPGLSPASRQLSLIESHYRHGQAFRAETEILRFLNDHPRHPAAGDVELLRAKLYYLQGRFGESSVMLISHLDRHPRHATARDAARLLTLSLVREGRTDEAQRYLPVLHEPGAPLPSLETLKRPPPDAVDADSAVLWSTILPGSGFFTLGEPGKAFAGLGLNLLLTAAAVISFEENQPVAGLLFLIAEIALYRGGREAVRDAAEAQLAAAERARREAWARRHGEREMLGLGLRMKFGGQ